MPSNRRVKRSSRPDQAAVENSNPPVIRIGIGLFLLSAVSLAFEVTLTHLFSVIFEYHFTFLAVSAAILGLGIGAGISIRLKPVRPAQLPQWLGRMAAIVALVLFLAVILFSLTGFVPGILWQALLGACPFLVVGLVTARLYTGYSKDSAWLYAFDLGGAAFGLLAILGLLDWMSATNAGFVLAAVAALSGLVFHPGNLRKSMLPAGVLGLALLALAGNLVFNTVDLPLVIKGTTPPDKTMFQVLAAAGSKGKIIDTAWSSFARVDLVTDGSADQMYAFTNAGAGSYMLRFDGNLNTVGSLTQQVEYLPFINFTPQKTLILGAGAGKDILQALLSGSQQITAVEINPAMLALTRSHADFNGGIMDYPGVTAVAADGRNYIERSTDSFDMIYLNLVYAQAPSPGANALSEAYMFTTPAFQQYWRHLASDGRLAIISHQGLEGTRALITAIRALNLEGISAPEALKRSALLMYNSSDPNQSTTVMILQKTPLTTAQVDDLDQAAQATGMSPLFLPVKYETLFSGLVDGKITLDQFMVQSDYNLFPTSDESPFFFNLNPGLPAALVTLLFTAFLVLAGYLFLAVNSRNRPAARQLVFFGGLGMGYILIEVPLIQRTLLLVGSPTLAMVVVLATLLLSGGIGSFLSSRWGTERLWQKLSLAALLVSLFSALLAFFQPAFETALGHQSIGMGILLGALLLVPLGLVMGVPFANGLRLVGIRDRNSLAYLWGWNAVSSVFGSALAAAMAIWVDFRAGMLLGAVCYLAVAVVSWMLAE